MIYIPRKEIMWKLMKACIGVSDEKELWFNRNITMSTVQKDKPLGFADIGRMLGS
jgi:hypothetical protein